MAKYTKKEKWQNILVCACIVILAIRNYIFEYLLKRATLMFWKTSMVGDCLVSCMLCDRPGWQNLAAFRREQKWPWKFSSSAYLPFSRQMRRFFRVIANLWIQLSKICNIYHVIVRAEKSDFWKPISKAAVKCALSRLYPPCIVNAASDVLDG